MPTLNNKNILVIDNDIDLLKVLREILTSEGYSVDTAESGRQAVERSKTSVYDLALIDIMLSDTEGIELLDILREDMPNTIKIMMTGHPTVNNAIEALNRGADAFITKPIDPEGLLELVKDKLKKREQAENLCQDKVSEWLEDRMRRLELVT
ncbi:hypothetical protein A3K70_00955 [Candidatus Bathyarchaeota archaeon RBG_16_48_13]|nr:MAG: hypothetical protein A3K70_00955 [Candidatus Bathyarchaeota archaeon RBG_16_48_13]